MDLDEFARAQLERAVDTGVPVKITGPGSVYNPHILAHDEAAPALLDREPFAVYARELRAV